MLENIGAGLDIETDGRLVEKQHARAMQQRARNLHPPHLAAGERARFIIGAASHRHLVQDRTGALLGVPRRNSVQRRMIGEILQDRQIEIERPRLENDTKPAQRLAGGAVHIEAENANPAFLRRVRDA